MSANVRDIDAIRHFRASLLKFAEELERALQSMFLEVQRGREWIEHDRPHYWTVQTRRAFDLVAATRSALNTCQMRTVAGRRPSCIEEKQAYERAKRRLQHCQEQGERIKNWTVKVHHDSDEFHARLARLGRLLESDIPQALALLERTIATLESYAEIAPPGDDE
ncbi:MAG: hypothetical protein KDA80_08395 [Planctomycetaceae bacterium]|nr:hypothetical protein [Planctomycetaceae bacterium]